MDFAAIDFETANEKRWSPCEVSITKVRNGSVEATYTRLIKPHSQVTFNPWNTAIHGINARDVKDSPEFSDIFDELVNFIDGLPLVAHSAGFDMGVLAQTASLYGVQLPEAKFFCTRVLAKQSKNLELANYGLVNVCDALDVEFLETHRAEADALACASVALSLAQLEGAPTLEELSAQLSVIPGRLSETGWAGTRSQRTRFESSMGKRAAASFLESVADEDLVFDDDFKGKEVIFTGTLSSMERKSAQEKVLRAGGFTGNNVTKKTSIVVVGTPYDAELQPGSQFSGKLKKVLDLQADGIDIEVITEREFLELFEN